MRRNCRRCGPKFRWPARPCEFAELRLRARITQISADSTRRAWYRPRQGIPARGSILCRDPARRRRRGPGARFLTAARLCDRMTSDPPALATARYTRRRTGRAGGSGRRAPARSCGRSGRGSARRRAARAGVGASGRTWIKFSVHRAAGDTARSTRGAPGIARERAGRSRPRGQQASGQWDGAA